MHIAKQGTKRLESLSHLWDLCRRWRKSKTIVTEQRRLSHSLTPIMALRTAGRTNGNSSIQPRRRHTDISPVRLIERGRQRGFFKPSTSGQLGLFRQKIKMTQVVFIFFFYLKTPNNLKRRKYEYKRLISLYSYFLFLNHYYYSR